MFGIHQIAPVSAMLRDDDAIVVEAVDIAVCAATGRAAGSRATIMLCRDGNFPCSNSIESLCQRAWSARFCVAIVAAGTLLRPEA